jgi:asparagine synthase (glutamine-hydrolysing)
MCGITGHWGYAGRDLGAAEFRAFTDSLAHRGPDGRGLEHFPSDRLWLGHQRLAILDVSERGRQPMSYADGRYWLTFNGEIYNFIELRETLRQLGHGFVSESDSEVVLAAYAEWGPECQLRFNGMWAFAIWDAREKRLFLSRDRFGVKPLHYADVDGCFSFASELKAFRQLPWCRGGLDEQVLAETLRNVVGQECTPHTLLSGVKRLPGGHCMTVGRDGTRIERWWSTLEHLPVPPADLADQAEKFREIFLDACRLRLRSDVAIATSLSGGLDSSAVACAISELGRRGAVDHVPEDWQRAFVACFPGTGLDERSYAEQIVAHTGMRAHYSNVDVNVAVEEIEKVIFDLEDLWYVPLVGAWSIYREMRRCGMRVSLDGHGADEFLGGYHFFVQAAIEEQFGTAFRPGRYLDLNRVRAGLAGGTRVGGSGELLTHGGIASDLQSLARRGVTRGLEQLGILDPIRSIRTRGQSWLLGTSPAEPILPAWTGSRRILEGDALQHGLEGASAQQKMLFEFFHVNVLPTFLRCIDRASMAHGIEVRMPFMDWRLVTFGFALPDESKIGGGYTKRVLRMAMRELMPDPVRLRTKKVHFSSPISDWARQGLGSWLLDIAASRAFREASPWNGKAAGIAVEQAVAGEASIDPVWPVVNAYVLQQHFKAEAPTELREPAHASASYYD